MPVSAPLHSPRLIMSAPAEDLETLLAEIRACRVCEAHLPLGPRPIVVADARARLLISGQAPALKVHQTGIPWNDASGDRLRVWLGIDHEMFYSDPRIAVIPQGFCYPGKGASGDLPPRPECAPLWHGRLLPQLPALDLVLTIGRYAQSYYLGQACGRTLTETVGRWRDYLPRYLPLPHPSWHNNRWLTDNPWFERDVLSYVRGRVRELLA